MEYKRSIEDNEYKLHIRMAEQNIMAFMLRNPTLIDYTLLEDFLCYSNFAKCFFYSFDNSLNSPDISFDIDLIRNANKWYRNIGKNGAPIGLLEFIMKVRDTSIY